MKKYNFSKKHWLIITFGFCMFFLYNACTSDGMNIIVPTLAEEKKWNYEHILSFATLAGCIGIFGQLLMGRICRAKGARFTIVLNLFAAAVFFFMYGHAVSVPMYVVSLCGVVTCSSSYAYIGGSVLVANWFPKKKGIAAGIMSMGSPFSTAVSVAIFTVAFQKIGFKTVMTIVCAILIVMAIWGAVYICDEPEQCGEWPDNEPSEAGKHFEIEENKGMSIKEMLCKRKMWIVGIIFGIYSMTTLGIMGQFVVRHMDLGLSRTTVLCLLTFCAVVGVAGSGIVGVLENKFGSTRAFCLCCVSWIVALLLNFSGNILCVLISVALFGLGLTGTQVFLTTFLVTLFGRKNFTPAYAIAYPVSSFFCQLCFLVNALALMIFNEIRYSYLFFAMLLVVAIILTLNLKLDKQSDHIL